MTTSDPQPIPSDDPSSESQQTPKPQSESATAEPVAEAAASPDTPPPLPPEAMVVAGGVPAASGGRSSKREDQRVHALPGAAAATGSDCPTCSAAAWIFRGSLRTRRFEKRRLRWSFSCSIEREHRPVHQHDTGRNELGLNEEIIRRIQRIAPSRTGQSQADDPQEHRRPGSAQRLSHTSLLPGQSPSDSRTLITSRSNQKRSRWRLRLARKGSGHSPRQSGRATPQSTTSPRSYRDWSIPISGC